MAGLFLVLIDLPDFPGWLGRIARAVERIAGIKPNVSSAELSPEGAATGAAPSEHATIAPDKPRSRTAKGEKVIHA